MKTEYYNPSNLEVSFANALVDLKDTIQKNLNGYEITNIESDTKADNPLIKIDLTDKEGDKHQLVLKVIQKADDFLDT